MKKMELEVKVLDIDKKQLEEKIKKIGGKFVEESIQKYYTYDLPTIYGRYQELCLQLKEPIDEIKHQVAIEKMKNLLFEIDNYISEKDAKELEKVTKTKDLQEVMKHKNYLQILTNQNVINIIKKYRNNENKWIRLRITNGRATLTIKHILKDKESSTLQQMQEIEMDVESENSAKDFLEGLGFSHKCFLEKKRTTYELQNRKIDIDTWPKIPTFFEVEGKDSKDIESFLNILGYSMKDEKTVSCIVDEVYQMYGFPKTTDFRELKFEKD